MTTVSEAIKIAEKRVSQLIPTFPKQWTYNTWSDKHNAWWLHGSYTYAAAAANRRRSLITEALVALGWNEEDAYFESTQPASGNWKQVVRAAVKAQSQTD